MVAAGESYIYDTENRVTVVTDALGNKTSYRYDILGRIVSVTDAVGVTTNYKYDLAGNLLENLATGEKYGYNVYGEQISYTDSLGNVTKVERNFNGDIVSSVDALGSRTGYTYQPDGAITKVTDASGAVTEYVYNNRGFLVKETDPLGAVTTYEYDLDGNSVKVTTPDGTVTEYAYNTDGNVTGITATKTDGEQAVLRYLYALDGSLTAAISDTTVDEYTYTKSGRVASVTRNGSHEVRLSYDFNGNLILLKEFKQGIYTPEAVTGYSYDTAGNLRKVMEGGTSKYRTVILADGTFTAQEYYADGQLLSDYAYYADGSLKQQTDGAGNVTTYGYDALKNLTSMSIRSADGTLLYQENNTYNKNRTLIKKVVAGSAPEAVRAAGTYTYTYDALDRLVKEQGSYGTIRYTYDVMGNRLTKLEDGTATSYVYDLCNRLLSETENGSTTEYIYDALGNLTTKTDNTGATTYVYDALNRLTEVVNPDGTWQRNTYDASGIRSTLCENGITTEYMTLNGMVLAGYDKNGERREHYFYGSSILGEELFGVATGTATATDTKETLCTFYLKNSHGDVIGQTDENGTLTKSYAYNAFGTLIHSTALDGVEDTMSRFLYSGEQYDTISGLYYLRARHYDTEAGRFTQEDTYLGDGRNLYAYVHNNPVMFTDPSGHDAALLDPVFYDGEYDANEWRKGVAEYTNSVKSAAKAGWNNIKSAVSSTASTITSSISSSLSNIGLSGFSNTSLGMANLYYHPALIGISQITMDVGIILETATGDELVTEEVLDMGEASEVTDGGCPTGGDSGGGDGKKPEDEEDNKYEPIEKLGDPSSTQYRQIYQVDNTKVQINSGHAYNRTHSGGNVSDFASMQETESTIIKDVSYRLQSGTIQNGDYSIYVNGMEIIYRIHWVPAINGYSINYFPPVD